MNPLPNPKIITPAILDVKIYMCVVSSTISIHYFRCRGRVLKLNLTIKETALMLAIMLFSPDRMGLSNSERVESLQDRFIQVRYS